LLLSWLLVMVGAAPSAPVPGAVVSATVVELHFVCGAHVVEQVVLTRGAEVPVRVPDGCPDAAVTWTLTLTCEDACHGTVADAGGRVAKVEGAGRRDTWLTVTPEPKAPSVVARLALKVVDRVRADATAEQSRPVRVVLSTASTTKSFSLDERLATIDVPGTPAQVAFEARRHGRDKTRLRVWSLKDGTLATRKLLFDRELTLGAPPVPFDCKPTQGFCDGQAQLGVKEQRGPERGL